jgi:phenylpyruvate tautomerase PptA (4-oxalocrotonate tautomerase family)
MPYLTLATNVEIPAETRGTLLKEASKTVAAGSHKPEEYVMVKIESGQPLLFAGSDAPAAFLELKSIGFPADGLQQLAASLCGLISKSLDIPGERIFIVFQDVKAAMWGQGGELFG